MNEKKRKDQEFEEEHNPSKKLGTDDQLGWSGFDLFGINSTPPHVLRRTPNTTPTSTPPRSPSHSPSHESDNEKFTRKKLEFEENGTIEIMTECIIASATHSLSIPSASSSSSSSSSSVSLHLHLATPVLSSDETLDESEHDEESQNQNQNQNEADGEAASAEADISFQLIKRLRYVVTQGSHPRPVLSQPLPVREPGRNLPTLVLDLDETLVHSSVEPLDNPDYSFAVEYNGHDYMVYARLRPNLSKFLHRVAELYEIVVFTASQRSYADKLLDILDPENKFFHHRLFREACTLVEGNYLKDLEILGRELSRVIIIDNSLQSFAFQLDNGIPITTWLEDKNDSGLVELLPLLEELSLLPDVRPSLRAKYRLHEKIE